MMMMKKKGMKKGGKMDVVKADKGSMKRKLTAAEEARELRSRLRGTTGGGKADVTPAYKKGRIVRGSGIARQGVRAAKMM